MFGYLKENEASKVDSPRPVDLSPECLSMMEKLMMAQAQVRDALDAADNSRGSSSSIRCNAMSDQRSIALSTAQTQALHAGTTLQANLQLKSAVPQQCGSLDTLCKQQLHNTQPILLSVGSVGKHRLC